MSALIQPVLRGLPLAGIPDLVEAVERSICQDAARELVGGSPNAVPERYGQASPAALLPTGIPQILINGGLDPIVPLDYARQYVDAATAFGDQVELQILPEAGHFEIVVPTTFAWETVRTAVRNSFNRY